MNLRDQSCAHFSSRKTVAVRPHHWPYLLPQPPRHRTTNSFAEGSRASPRAARSLAPPPPAVCPARGCAALRCAAPKCRSRTQAHHLYSTETPGLTPGKALRESRDSKLVVGVTEHARLGPPAARINDRRETKGGATTRHCRRRPCATFMTSILQCTSCRVPRLRCRPVSAVQLRLAETLAPGAVARARTSLRSAAAAGARHGFPWARARGKTGRVGAAHARRRGRGTAAAPPPRTARPRARRGTAPARARPAGPARSRPRRSRRGGGEQTRSTCSRGCAAARALLLLVGIVARWRNGLSAALLGSSRGKCWKEPAAAAAPRRTAIPRAVNRCTVVNQEEAPPMESSSNKGAALPLLPRPRVPVLSKSASSLRHLSSLIRSGVPSFPEDSEHFIRVISGSLELPGGCFF